MKSFYLFLEFRSISKEFRKYFQGIWKEIRNLLPRKQKLEETLLDFFGLICGLFHDLAEFPFTTSDVLTKKWVCVLSHELPNNLRIRNLDN